MYSVIVKFRLSTLYQIAYYVDTKKYSGLELTPVHTATKSGANLSKPINIGVTQLRSVTEIAPKSP